MDVEAFTTRIREHYLEQFRAFVTEQKRGCSKWAAEVKLQLSQESGLYKQLYCADFIKNDPPEVVELQPDRILKFEPFSGAIGDARLRVEYLRWDDVLVHHDAGTPLGGLDQWFTQWFDEEEKRLDPTAEFSGAIHSLLSEAGRLSVDFGSAPAVAFWELLNLLQASGATTILVTSSRDEASE